MISFCVYCPLGSLHCSPNHSNLRCVRYLHFIIRQNSAHFILDLASTMLYWWFWNRRKTADLDIFKMANSLRIRHICWSVYLYTWIIWYWNVTTEEKQINGQRCAWWQQRQGQWRKWTKEKRNESWMYRSSTVNMTSISFDQKCEKGPTSDNGIYFICMRPTDSIACVCITIKIVMTHATMMTMIMVMMITKTGTTSPQTMTFVWTEINRMNVGNF